MIKHYKRYKCYIIFDLNTSNFSINEEKLVPMLFFSFCISFSKLLLHSVALFT